MPEPKNQDLNQSLVGPEDFQSVWKGSKHDYLRTMLTYNVQTGKHHFKLTHTNWFPTQTIYGETTTPGLPEWQTKILIGQVCRLKANPYFTHEKDNNKNYSYRSKNCSQQRQRRLLPWRKKEATLIVYVDKNDNLYQRRLIPRFTQSCCSRPSNEHGEIIDTGMYFWIHF